MTQLAVPKRYGYFAAKLGGNDYIQINSSRWQVRSARKSSSRQSSLRLQRNHRRVHTVPRSWSEVREGGYFAYSQQGRPILVRIHFDGGMFSNNLNEVYIYV